MQQLLQSSEQGLQQPAVREEQTLYSLKDYVLRDTLKAVFLLFRLFPRLVRHYEISEACLQTQKGGNIRCAAATPQLFAAGATTTNSHWH